jgi:phenylpropionate dioxygenase-like ring-hydroxylating dioxygenase large terminal subunit
MDSTTEARLRQTITEIVLEKRTSLAENVRLVPSADYVDPERLRKEREVLFRTYPLAVTLSCRLPGTNDFVTEEVAGRSVLVVRGGDGVVRAFVNACRHRANTLCTAAAGSASRFTCGYHAWSYGTDGSVRFSDKAAFEGLDPKERGLVELPCEERHGLVWIVPTPGASLDVAAYLGPQIDSELGDFGMGTQIVFAEDTLSRDFNWKLSLDSFLEVYHLNILHKNSLPGMFAGLAAFEGFGKHFRFTPIRSSFDQKAIEEGTIESVLPHTTVLYLLFPNTLVLWQMDHIELWHMYPDPTSDERCRMRVFLLVKEPPDERATRYWNRNWEVLQNSVWKEDFETMTAMQKNMRTGTLASIVFGRNEFALQHLHDELDKALESST